MKRFIKDNLFGIVIGGLFLAVIIHIFISA
jgi:hypothetical protein